MAQHGYLREYDEGWDRSGDRDRDRERGWRDDDRERGWRGGEPSYRNSGNDERHSDERAGNFMLGQRDRGPQRNDRGRGGETYSRHMGDRGRSSFSDDDRQYRGTQQDQWGSRERGSSSGYGREHGYGGFQDDYSRSQASQGGLGGRGDWERSPRGFSSHQDDHYRSWRDRQMNALDRDYEDYCREREQQFHNDFDSWRRNRQNQGSNQQPQQQGAAGSSEEVMELTSRTQLSPEPQSGPSPTGEATLGTNNSENSSTGGRR